MSDVLNGWNSAGNAKVERAEIAATKAIGLNHDTPFAHHALGWVHRISGNHQAALDAFNEAIRIDPNFAAAYAQAANELVFLGDARVAIPLTEKAAELSPNDRSFQVFLWVKGRAHFVLGEYEKSVEALRGIGPCAAQPLVYPRLADRSLCPDKSGGGSEEAGPRTDSGNITVRERTSTGSPDTTAKINTGIPRCKRLWLSCCTAWRGRA